MSKKDLILGIVWSISAFAWVGVFLVGLNAPLLIRFLRGMCSAISLFFAAKHLSRCRNK